MRFDSNLFSRPHYALHLKDPFYHHILMIPDLTVVPSASTRHLIVPEAVAVAAAVAVATEAAATDVAAAVVATTAAAAVVSLRFIPLRIMICWQWKQATAVSGVPQAARAVATKAKVKAAMVAAAASVEVMATSSSSRAAAVAASGKLLKHSSFYTQSNVCQHTALAVLEG
jgi:hypothetical protein